MTTVGGAIKATLEPVGQLEGRIGRDYAPESAQYPFVTFIDPVSTPTIVRGTGGFRYWRRRVQVDLWQRREAEDDTLIDTLVATLDGARLTGTATHVVRCRVVTWRRLANNRDSIIHHAIDLFVDHGG